MNPRTGLVIALLAVSLATTACSSGSGGAGASATPTGSGTSGPTTTAAAGSSCGVHTIDGVQVRTFCGTGTATVKNGASTMTIPNATCESTPGYVAVNAGTIVLGFDAAATKVKAATQYIGLTVGRLPGDTTSTPATKDGTYTGGVLGLNDKGDAPATRADTVTTTLTGNRTAGTFKADLLTGGSVTGSFSCG